MLSAATLPVHDLEGPLEMVCPNDGCDAIDVDGPTEYRLARAYRRKRLGFEGDVCPVCGALGEVE